MVGAKNMEQHKKWLNGMSLNCAEAMEPSQFIDAAEAIAVLSVSCI